MAIKYVQASNAPKPAGPYSQGVRAGDFVFVSGQLGRDPETGTVREGFEAQAIQVLENIEAVLESVGGTMQSVVKAGVYLRNLSDWQAMNSIYEKFFPNNKPARTTVQTTLRENFLIEIDVVAYLSSDASS